MNVYYYYCYLFFNNRKLNQLTILSLFLTVKLNQQSEHVNFDGRFLFQSIPSVTTFMTLNL